MRLPKPRMGLAGFTAAMALVATVASCAQEGAVKNMDQVSRDRLQGVPEDATVLVSVRAESVPAELPPLGEAGREIMRTPGAVLVEILHRNLSKLDAIPGIEDAAYWAPGEAGGRIDGWFRRRLLTAWAAGDTTAIAVTVTFPSDAEAARARSRRRGRRCGRWRDRWSRWPRPRWRSSGSWRFRGSNRSRDRGRSGCSTDHDPARPRRARRRTETLAVNVRLTGLLAALALVAVLSPAPAGADAFEPNDSLSVAYGPLQSGVAIHATIAAESDVDWYWLEAGQGDMTVTLSDIPAGSDYDLFLTDKDGNIYADSQSRGDTTEVITVPVTAGGPFWIKVKSFLGSTDSETYALTPVFFPVVNEPPSVTVLSPNGGESWSEGSVHAITWDASDPEDGQDLTIRIDWSANDGVTWTPVDSLLANTGAHDWTVPPIPTADARVRVTAEDGDGGRASDVNDLSFAVLPAVVPDLSLRLPSGLAAGPGDSVWVPIDFESNLEAASLEFTLEFDPGRGVALAVMPGPRSEGRPMTVDLSTAGEARISFTSSPGNAFPPGSGTVASVRFRIPDEPAGNLTLAFTRAAAADSDGTPLAVNAPGGQVVPVRAVTLAASADDGEVRLAWSAAVDGGVAGFRVLRAEAGDPAPVHPGLLPASARDYLDRSAAPGRGYRYWLEAVERDGARERFGPAAVQVPVVALRAGLPYPNPTREGAALDLIGSPGSPVRARVVDMRGRVVARLAVSAGTGPVIWDGRLDTGPEAPAGVYFIRVESDRASTTRRLVKVGR